MNDRIDSLAELEAVIGKTPAAIHLKVIDHLDVNALRWIAASPLAFATFAQDSDIAITLAGGAPGFACGEGSELRIPLATLDEPGLARPGAAFGSLFLAPGIGETLRVNGMVAATDAEVAVIRVSECYGHCAKALIRSDFWTAAPVDVVPRASAAFVGESRFLALATIDAKGQADLSPKGDPAGSMARLGKDRLWFADRPGNRRVDSFRNILAQPRIAGALLLPGATSIVALRGKATLTTDLAEREAFAVRGKTPALAIAVDNLELELRPSPALARAALWPLNRVAEGIDPAKMFVAHVRMNKDKSLLARIGGAVMSIPGLMQKGLDSDYKNNLY
mgnify:CR=1 FL=1